MFLNKNIIKAVSAHSIKNDNAKKKREQFSGTLCSTGKISILYCPEEIHPSGKGYEEIAKLFT